jgi:hypothetical protein
MLIFNQILTALRGVLVGDSTTQVSGLWRTVRLLSIVGVSLISMAAASGCEDVEIHPKPIEFTSGATVKAAIVFNEVGKYTVDGNEITENIEHLSIGTKNCVGEITVVKKGEFCEFEVVYKGTYTKGEMGLDKVVYTPMGGTFGTPIFALVVTK